MKVIVDRTPGRLSLAPVSDAIAAQMVNAMVAGADRLGELTLQLQLKNTLAMATGVYVDEEGGTATIVLDWAQMERLAIVAREIDWSDPPDVQKQSFFKAAARELRVYWKRKLVTSNSGPIADEDRWYDGRKEGDTELLKPLDSCDNAVAVRYGFFLLTHELCHLIARESRDSVERLYLRFEEEYPRLINPSPSLAEELYCDHQALIMLSDQGVYPSAMDLNNEFALAMAVERLQNEVRAAAPRIRHQFRKAFGGDDQPHSPAKEARLVAEWRYRMFQVDLMLDEMLARAGYDDASRARAGATRKALYRWPEEALAEDYMGWLN